MKQWASEARDALVDRWTLLGMSVRNTFRMETAYVFENWASALSTVAYTLTYILFIDVLFRSVPTFAGYTRGEMLFFMLVAQGTFYCSWIWSTNNVQLLERDIRSGSFDLLLTKPVPLLFYGHTRRIALVNFLRTAPPALVAICLVVPWSELPLELGTTLAALGVFLLGQLALNAVQSIAVLPAFWFAGATILVNLPSDVIERYLPIEALPRWYVLAFTIIIPLLLQSALTVAVALGRTDALLALAVSAGATLLVSWLRVRLWQLALRSYTSASS